MLLDSLLPSLSWKKQFKVFGQHCPYTYLTSERVNIRKHQGKGLGKHELQRKTHRPSNLVLFKPKCVKMRWRVSTSFDSPVQKASAPATMLAGLHLRAGCSPHTAFVFTKLFRNGLTYVLWEQTQPGDCWGVNEG